MNSTCPDCGKKAMFTGSVGSREFYKCRHCGAGFSKDLDDANEYEFDDAGNQIYIGGEPPDGE